MLFPSIEWFEALKGESERARDRFHRVGSCDALVGVKVAGRRFVLEFSDLGCASVRELPGEGEGGADFTLSAPLAVWREMLENIAQNAGADLHHTLNYLQFPGTLQLEGRGQLERDVFYRFNQTFQQFFDLAHLVPTEFEAA